uniref:NADH-ubiquinone oxidoreductase chain 4L n=1 Tax=Trioza erytreae TaxID=1778831 RepID=A0A6M8Y5X2_TRIEB|nr:NADH dehydrogenase subunit 4L [Trioza erytreae]QKK36468.1 NADH dehydrogenase subunit 4L [Trioza erytreae]
MLIYFSYLFMFYFGMVSFFSIRTHILMMLLMLEFLNLTIIMMIINFMIYFSFDEMIIVYLLIFMVCEAVMGLIMLTLCVRTHGNDYFKSMSLLMC